MRTGERARRAESDAGRKRCGLSTTPQDPLEQLAQTARVVCFAGLPGTGKSFLARRLGELGSAAGRSIYLLQWDSVRPVFEASPSGRRYPIRDGVTHAMIRKAAGVWVREAVLGWHELHPGEAPLLIGETPLIGNRFVELARRHDDPAEALLSSDTCVFVVPVPSASARRELEASRANHAAAAADDRGGAVPVVVAALWDELVEVSRKLGISDPGGGAVPYDAALYERVYGRVLVHRRRRMLHVEALERGAAGAKARLTFPASAVVPTPDVADRTIRETEARYPRCSSLDREVENWYAV